MEKQKTKIKTYVLMVSRVFMKTHPRAGELTGFRRKIKSGKKIHTIRGNYTYWNNVVREVNAGRAVLSLRQWTDKPYNSPEEEFMVLNKVGIQSIDLKPFESSNIKDISIDNTLYYESTKSTIAKNDGLSEKDFNDWFKGYPNELMAIIHFTDFRY